MAGLGLVALACLTHGCRRAEPPPAPPPPAALDPGQLDAGRALTEAGNFCLVYPRHAGTPGAARAASYLHARLGEAGLAAEVDSFPDITPEGEKIFRNVIGRIPGRDGTLVIVGAHYDTKAGIGEGFQGANDSASGAGLLLELARVAAGAGDTLPAETWFVFFDGEESLRAYGPHDGFHGSRHMAAQLRNSGRWKQTRAFILLDMIGDRDLTVTLPRNCTPEMLTLILRAAHAEGVRERFGLHPFAIGDDHVPFLEAGIPAVNLIDFDYGSAPGLNDHWHTPADTMDKLSADSLRIVGRVVLHALNELARPE